VTDDDLNLQDALVELGHLYNELGGVLARGEAVSTNEKVRASKGVEVPMPISPEVFDLRSAIVQCCERWELRVRTERSIPGVMGHPRRGRLAHQSQRLELSLTLLTAHAPWAEDQAWGKTCYRDIDKLRRRARLLIGHDSPIIRVDMPCPACDVVALIRHHGWGYVKCANCETRIDEETYSFAVKVALAQAQQNASSTEPTQPVS
jgi:hypothetical protein